jgi:hypothetical protein
MDNSAARIGLRVIVRMSVRLRSVCRRGVHYHMVPGVPYMADMFMGRVSRMVVLAMVVVCGTFLVSRHEYAAWCEIDGCLTGGSQRGV